MIKKYLLGLGLTIITIINFSNAGTVQSVGLDKQNSEYNSAFKVGFIKGGGVITEYLGTSKSVLALNSDVLFWWAENGQPYFYAPGFQGFFGEFYTCNVLTGTNSPFASNCQATTLTDDYKNIFKSFFSKVKQGDYAGYDYFYNRTSGGNGYNHQARIQVCFSSEEIGNSLCFRYSSCQVSSNLSYCNGRNYGSLVNSQNLSNLTFANIPYSYISYAPGQNGYDGSRDNEENNTNTNTNNNYTCPTIAQVIKNMGNNYNTGLCYNNTSYFNGTNFEQIEKEDIFTIYNNDYQNYINRISIYRNNCTNANTTQACQKAFSGEYKKYSIISNAINSNVDEKKLRNYCNLGLNYDPNATTCVASGGGIKEPYTTEELINDITNNGVIPTPTNTTTGENNNVLNALNKCESGDRDCYLNNRNFIESLGNIYGKITGLFKERNNVNGIIPEYILRITFLTILFTVIFKK